MMDKDPAESSSRTGTRSGGGLGGLFRSAGPGYSHSELAGVPLTGMNPLSPYLNVDPRYLIQDVDELILPTGANKTRGRFELAFFTIGACCMTVALFGAFSGLRTGLSETKHMAWSKPRNSAKPGDPSGCHMGKHPGLAGVLGIIVEKARGAEDDLNTVAAGTMTGVLYKSPGGVRGGIIGLALSGLYALYNNWDHLKGSSPTHF